MSTIEEVRARLKPVQAEAHVCLDGSLFRERDQINEELDQFRAWEPSTLSDVDPRKPLQEALADVEKRMRDETVPFVFRSIGDKASSDLLAAHPSPKDDKGEERFAFNPATYPVALCAAASMDPLMSVADVEFLFDGLNLNGRNKLFNAAYSANNRSIDVPFLSPASEPVGGTETK